MSRKYNGSGLHALEAVLTPWYGYVVPGSSQVARTSTHPRTPAISSAAASRGDSVPVGGCVQRKLRASASVVVRILVAVLPFGVCPRSLRFAGLLAIFELLLWR